MVQAMIMHENMDERLFRCRTVLYWAHDTSDIVAPSANLLYQKCKSTQYPEALLLGMLEKTVG